MSKHTQGPWHYTVEQDGSYEICVASGAWLLRCTSASNPSLDEQEEDEANVRMAAAAPELLAILQEIVEADDDAMASLRMVGLPTDLETSATALTNKARAVIAKATGAAA
jgi:hypothetical protein